MTSQQTATILLEPNNPTALINLCGQFDAHLKLLEERTGVEIRNRGNRFQLVGPEAATRAMGRLLEQLYQQALKGEELTPEALHLLLQDSGIEQPPKRKDKAQSEDDKRFGIRTRKVLIKPRPGKQQDYVHQIRTHDINFGIGPAGTGKTYLAVACAVEALEREEVSRILLVRPAVEAGEKLGFLPGDLSQKVDPYLRPLYDALYEMMGFERVAKLIERNVIEVAPLAYMRGRTLNGSFVILDESQNTTREQMKMFLTRIGFGSTAVITGDKTQIDLPKGVKSGLLHAMEVLDGVKEIGFTYFGSKDVVRHPLVQHIVEAYERHEEAQPDGDAR
ncbi:PhoH family protein [Marinobacterium stanieri]|uniref:PhoH-like protein n=1 Tax=Marinobacterium stanieri TaxID=49186 RepID=A0A1N6V8Z0_9GAMM|nr:PhoH family protein [Marinobacterium stanieri]SIQ74106.1 phosphate starvation-inducible protein PhoH [Marinobacterium stanieri]